MKKVHVASNDTAPLAFPWWTRIAKAQVKSNQCPLPRECYVLNKARVDKLVKLPRHPHLDATRRGPVAFG